MDQEVDERFVLELHPFASDASRHFGRSTLVPIGFLRGTMHVESDREGDVGERLKQRIQDRFERFVSVSYAPSTKRCSRRRTLSSHEPSVPRESRSLSRRNRCKSTLDLDVREGEVSMGRKGGFGIGFDRKGDPRSNPNIRKGTSEEVSDEDLLFLNALIDSCVRISQDVERSARIHVSTSVSFANISIVLRKEIS